MSTKKKEKFIEEEIKEEQPVEKLPEVIGFELPLSDVMQEEGIVHPIYVPDMPAQMLDSSFAEEPKDETEIEFLQRILWIQEDGGFGRHLHTIINDRIKSLS